MTRERWLLPLFSELGYGRLLTTKALEVEGKTYPISHGWQHTPMHLVGCQVDLDRRAAGVAGASRSSPHGLVQELLNRSDAHLWGMVSNGLRLRILRDNSRLTRQAYVEFDLEAMMTGEVYADFVLLWLLCHESRVEAERPETCWLEQWSKAAQEQGTRALDQLRKGVEEAITALGRGFLTHPANQGLRDALRSGTLEAQEYYRELLRLVYRLLFLFVAEDRELLCLPHADPAVRERYTRFYSTARLRRLAGRRVGTRHADLFHGLRLVMQKLGGDAGCPELALPALGSLLFSDQAIPALDPCEIANHDLLDAIRALAFSIDGNSRRIVDYKNLGSEELGSVYESLLELHPVLHLDAGTFALKTAGGHERKTTGSYYTPTSLIQCLLDSALEPVLEETARQNNPEAAILKLKICDPACGSGHFLIAAAHRIAKRLAAVRTGDEEPSPEATRTALRDVIGHCIYGVDLNPMAVELCKVSLWMEALEPGKPLSFLDHRIQCGNSLLGATPALLLQGISDEAFDPIEGDDKEVCKKFRKQNKEERGEGKVKPGEGRVRGQIPLFDAADQPWQRLGDLATGLLSVEEIPDDTIEGIRRKQERYEELVRSAGYLYGRLWADAWCAAFVWKKTKEFLYPITEEAFRRIERNPFSVAPWMRDETQRLAQQYQFFHWHLAFPDVFRLPREGEKPESEQAGWSGGFHVILENPPWEKIQIEEKLFFSSVEPRIAEASAAQRKQLIRQLAEKSPPLFQQYREALRSTSGQTHLVRGAGAYPLVGKGNVSTHTIFIELVLSLVMSRGRIGLIVPSGLATQDSQKDLFRFLVKTGKLHCFYDFENREGIFVGIHRSFKFCILIIGEQKEGRGLQFAFYLQDVRDLNEANRRFFLSYNELQKLSPNTLSCPTFRNNSEVRILNTIYQHASIILSDDGEIDPWGWHSWQMFNETHEAEALRGWTENWENENLLKLYEAKFFHQFDHRYTTCELLAETSTFRSVDHVEKHNPHFVIQSRYCVGSHIWQQRVTPASSSNWIIGFRKIARATDERTAIFTVLPKSVTGSQTPVATTKESAPLVACLLANLNSFIFDFATRLKVGGTDLNHFIVHQLPVLTPTFYERDVPLKRVDIAGNVLELSYTAWDLEPFAKDCGYNGPPFLWDEQRRFVLRCELDAAYFHLYGLARDDVDYIMDTFPIVKRKDEQKYGEYRTKRVILEIYDAMVEAVRTGKPYEALLNPPPADPRVAHPPRQAAAG